MKNIIGNYRSMSYEQRTVLKTIIGLCFSTVLACGKAVVGLIVDYRLCSIAVYTFAILISKLECVLGIKTDKRSFETRNMLVAVSLFVSSMLYIGFMVGTLFVDYESKQRGLVYVLIAAFISFAELGFAIAGIFRTKDKGHFYRDIKIINFCIAVIAILTTQTAILNFCAPGTGDKYNAIAGIAVGCFIAVCAIYIFFAPRICVIDREFNEFMLKDSAKNTAVNMNDPTAIIPLCKSLVYGSYVYRAIVAGERLSGNIEREASLWKHMHIITKILCCILSEILVFAWLIGRFVFFMRSLDIPKRLETKMTDNGFVKVEN